MEMRELGLRRFRSYPAYKDSGVRWLGEIPAGWDRKRLKRVTDFRGGGTPSKGNVDYWRGEIPWVSPKDMKVSVVVDTEDKITAQAVRESATKLIPAGAVLIVVRSGILVHSIPVALSGCEVTLNQDLKAIIPRPELLPDYLMYLIAGMQRELLVEWKKEGATVESLELELVANTLTPLPTLTEQRAIATFLDRETANIDALVANKERLIELLQEERTALITRAVTKGLDPNVPMKHSGVEWLGEIPSHWDVKALKRLASLRAGAAITAESIEEVGVFPVFGGNGIRGFTSSYTHEGDFPLIGRQGALCGCVNFASGRFWASEHAVVAAPRAEVHAYWLAYLLRAMSLNSYSESAAQPGLAVDTISGLLVPAPGVSEQRPIAAFLNRETATIDALVAKVRDAIDRLKELRTALIAAAVTGKIDIREDAA